MRTYYLYVLVEPEVNIPKYIGITNNPKERLLKHLEDKSITKKTKWIKSLREGGKLPKMVIIKTTNDVQQVIDWEIKAIAQSEGKYDLTNSTKGGEYYGIGSPIDVYDLNGTYLNSYSSMIEFCELHNLPENFVSAISLVCKKVRNYAHNYIFRYSGEPVTEDDLIRLNKSLSIEKSKHFFVLDLDGNIIKEYDSCMDAEKDGLATANRIGECLNHPERNCSISDKYLIVRHPKDYDTAIKNYLSHLQQNENGQWICQYSLDGTYLNRFASVLEAAKSLGIEYTNNIKACLLNKQKMAYDYIWKYSMTKENTEQYVQSKAKNIRRYVLQYDLNNNLLNTFSGLKEAAKFIGKKDGGGIGQAIRGNRAAYGYIWKYGNAV